MGILSLGLLSLGGFVFGGFIHGASVLEAFVLGASVRAPSVCVKYKVIGTTSDTLLARGSSSGTDGFLRWNAVDNILDNSYSHNC